MRILFFFTYNRSFLSQFYVDLCTSLSNLGYDVKIYSLKKIEGSSKLDSGVEIQILKKGNRYRNFIKLFRIIKAERPDVVVSNFSYVNPVVFASNLLGVKNNIVWFHTVRKAMNFSKKNMFIKSLFMSMSSAIIANSETLRKEVNEDYNQKLDKIFAIPFTTSINSIKEENILLEKNEEYYYIGCPGRLNCDKNQAILIDAISILKSPNIIIVFAGIKEEDVIENHKHYLPYKDRILHLGALSKEEMKGFYNKMDMIVLPSHNEAFGLVLIEALALGKTTLVSKEFGALGFIVNDTSSITFDPKDPMELAQKIKYWISSKEDPQYFRSLYNSNFSLDNIVISFNAIIKT